MQRGDDGKSRYHEGQSHDGRELPREDYQQAPRRRPLSQRALRFSFPFSCVLQQTIHPYPPFVDHISSLSFIFFFPLRTLGLNRHRLQTILGGLHGGYLNASLGTSALKALLLHRVLLLVLSLVGGDLDVVGVRQRSLIGSPQILRD